ncbi:MAG: hypothetical protein M3O71_26025 [Bacteroidota bacterium]|nr:hypothetical protein [Bacteroidota bacterium]
MDHRPWTKTDPMHLAYSAIGTTNNNPQNGTKQHEPENEQLLRYLAYQSTCEKFSREIEAIQKYIKGWLPSPPTP